MFVMFLVCAVTGAVLTIYTIVRDDKRVACVAGVFIVLAFMFMWFGVQAENAEVRRISTAICERHHTRYIGSSGHIITCADDNDNIVSYAYPN